MPGYDIQIGDDGDYIDDGIGGFQLTPTAQPAIRHQLMDILGAWVGNTTAGRDIPGKGRNNTLAEAELERAGVLNALAVLERQGLITNSRCVIDRDQANRYILRVSSVDVQSGGTITISSLESFGG